MVVAIVGMCGSGKTVVSGIFKSHGWTEVYFGSIIIDAVKERGLSLTPENERRVRQAIRRDFGQAAFAVRFLPAICEYMRYANVVIDGLYTWSEYKYLKDRLGNQLMVLCILSDRELRYQRLSHREDRPLSVEEAVRRDYSEIEDLEKGGPIAIADKYIVNNGDMKSLSEQIKTLIEDIS